MTNRFTLNRADGKLMGVSAGIADHFDIDPLLVRLGWVAALFITGPIALVAYILTGLVAD